MARQRLNPFSLIFVAGLLAALAASPAPAAAQSGTPRSVASVTLNSGGGGAVPANPRFIIYENGTFATNYDRTMISGGSVSSPATGFMLYHEGTLYGGSLTDRSEAPTKAYWTSTSVTENVADAAASVVLGAGTITVTVNFTTLPPVGLAINVTFDPVPSSTSTRLYFVSAANVYGQPLNNIETYYVETEGDKLLSYDDESSGLRYIVGVTGGLSGDSPDSGAVASEPCIFGKLSDCPTTGPAGGAQYGGDETASDMAIGAEWSAFYSNTPSMIWAVFAAPIPSTAAPAAPAAQCLNTTDMAISPERIELSPGGSAVVNLTLRNTDRVAQGYHDAVLSLSDGLSVTAVSDGVANLGQRAALEGFVLQPNETRSLQVTVSAAEQLSVAPLHVAELYCGGQVVSRIDGVFVPAATEAAATDTGASAAPAPAAAAPAPAPLPAALPNTAGDQLPAALPVGGWLLAIVALACVLRRRTIG